MTINPDGTGYAVSNDANTFIRFTTNKKLQITQLGLWLMILLTVVFLFIIVAAAGVVI
jgi:hypothetical protein